MITNTSYSTIKNNFLDDCLKANKVLSHYINNELGQKDFLSLNTIGYGGDDIKYIDKYAEDIFVKYLLKYANIISEESGYIKSYIQTSNIIYLDPIDGSDNLVSSLPYYCTSIAIEINNKVSIAFIYNLVNDTYYYKTLHSTNIISNNHNKEPIGIFERAHSKPEIVLKLQELNLKFRSPGATALSLANTHNYNFFLLAGKIRKEDVSAGLFICNDLNIYENKSFLLVCTNNVTFHSIKEIIKDI